MNRSTLLLSVLLAALLLGGITYLYLFLERYEYQVSTGASAEANAKPYLAAMWYLEELDRTVVEHTGRVDWADISTQDVVILMNIDKVLVSREQIDAALDWAFAGGRIVGGVGQPVEGGASLVAELGVDPEFVQSDFKLLDDADDDLKPSEAMRQLNEQIKEKHAEQEQASDKASSETRSTEELLEELLGDIDNFPETFAVSFADLENELEVRVDDRIRLAIADVEEEWPFELLTWAASVEGDNTKMLMFAVGEGDIALFSSSNMWTNKQIGQRDNAYLLSNIAPKNFVTHVYYDYVSVSIFVLLWKYFAELLSISLLMLALWVWRSSVRDRPIRSTVVAHERSFIEHLNAGARFMSQHHLLQPLADAVAAEVLEKVRAREPGFDALSLHAQAGRISELTSTRFDVAQTWLEDLSDIRTEAQLLNMVATAKHFLRALEYAN